MRLQDNVLAAHAAPAASMPLARLHEINGTLVFGAPRAFDDAVPRFIDLDKTSRRQDGIHREVLRSYVAVSELAVRELRQVRNWNQSPLFHHASEICSAPVVKTRIHAHRNLHRRQS